MSFTVRFAADRREPTRCIDLPSESEAIAEATRLAREGAVNRGWAALRLASGLTYFAFNVDGEVETASLAN